MAKRKTEPRPMDADELVTEFDRIMEKWHKGEVSDEELWEWWRSHLGIKGSGILASFLKQRELARGWDKKPKQKRQS